MDSLLLHRVRLEQLMALHSAMGWETLMLLLLKKKPDARRTMVMGLLMAED